MRLPEIRLLKEDLRFSRVFEYAEPKSKMIVSRIVDIPTRSENHENEDLPDLGKVKVKVKSY